MKMKPSAYKTLLFLWGFALATSTLFASSDHVAPDFRREFVKEINKSFPLDSDGHLELSNRHGQINVQSWDKEETKINIRIIVQAGDQEEANEVFERVRISFTDTRKLVTATTQINASKDSWWDRLFGSYGSDDFKIIYDVKMPTQAYLQANGQYCNVSCDDHAGESSFYVKYGNLNAGELGGRTQIEVGYGNANIENLKTSSAVQMRYGNLDVDRAAGELEVDIRYGELQLKEVNELILDSRYTEVEVGKAVRIRIDGSYGDLQIGEVRNLRATTTYLGYEIDQVLGSADITTAYGDVEIDFVKAGFEEIRVKGSYADIELRMDPTAGYEMNARTSYSDIDYPNGMEVNRKENKSNSASMEGRKKGIGSGKLDLSSAYGDISVRD